MHGCIFTQTIIMKIKILLLPLTFLLSFSLQTKAQDEHAFKTGSSAINLGIGFGNTVFYNNGLIYGNGSTTATPIFMGSYEYGMTRLGRGVIGAGIQFGYQGSHYNYKDISGMDNQIRYTTIAFSPRVTYHLDVLGGKKFDTYGIVQLNIYSYGISNTAPTGAGFVNTNSSKVGLRPAVLIGIRYFFAPYFGLFAEAGYDICIVKAGLSFKFTNNG